MTALAAAVALLTLAAPLISYAASPGIGCKSAWPCYRNPELFTISAGPRG